MKKWGLLALCLVVLSGCGGGGGGDVPRERTLVLGIVQLLDHDAFNPFVPSATTAAGMDYSFEPLYFYNAYSAEGELIPWIAEGHEYNEDFTEVTIGIRPGVKWSDGVPWTAADIAFRNRG